jgi:hypothetical protein
MGRPRSKRRAAAAAILLILAATALPAQAQRRSTLLKSDASITNAVSGNLSVAGGARLRLYGLVTGDLIVERGGAAEVYGMVQGTVVNRGGEVAIYGAVGGLNGSAAVSPGAMVGMRPAPLQLNIAR